MNPIYLLLAGAIIIAFFVSPAITILIDKYIKDETPKKAASLFIDASIWIKIGLMVLVSNFALMIWYVILSIIFESILSMQFTNDYHFSNLAMFIVPTIFYLFCYFLVSYSLAVMQIANKK